MFDCIAQESINENINESIKECMGYGDTMLMFGALSVPIVSREGAR